MTMRQLILWFLVLMTVLWGVVMQIEMSGYVNQPSTLGAQPLPTSCRHAFSQAIGDLELASGSQCFTSLIAPAISSPEANNDRYTNLRLSELNTRLDFGFISLYWLTFLAFAWLYWKDSKLACVAIVVIATATALLDVGENFKLFAAFRAVSQGSAQFSTSHTISFIKWCLLGVTTVILGLLPLKDEGRLRKLIGILLMVSGILIAGGTLVGSNPALGMLGLSISLLLALPSYFPSDLPFSAVLAYAYLLRFPILSGLLLAVALPAGYFAAPSIFRGLFDAIAPTSFFLICFTALLLSLVVMITARITLAYGPDRFCDLLGTNSWTRSSWKPTILFSLLSLPMIVLTWVGTEEAKFSWFTRLGEVLLAMVCAFLFLFLTAELHAYFELSGTANPTVCFVYPPFRILQPRGTGPSWLTRLFSRLLAWILPGTLGEGLLKPQNVGGQQIPLLRSGHRLAATACAATIFLYVILGFATSPKWNDHGPAAMFYVLFLLSLLTWLFAGVSFFLDKLRLPVLTAVIAGSMLFATVGGSDHVFELLKPAHDVSLHDPTQVIDSWVKYRKDPGAPIVVVATAGGGIRASAWTAQVLTGLAESCQVGEKNNFTSSVVLISSVSGGSEGAMYFAGWYDGQGNTDLAKAKAIRNEAAKTDLGAVGWGLLYPDFLRTIPGSGLLNVIWPDRRHIDRGWSLENEWIRHWDGYQNSPSLSEWADDVANGTRPALIFNSTVAESGERFVAATTELYEQSRYREQGTVQFFDSYSKADLPVSTAARLSATFPFVSPMARADTDRQHAQLHFADGGYYDNSGLLSATQWLRGANGTLQDHQVILLIIDAGPGAEPLGSDWTWQRQAVAPVGTFLAVRTSSQELRAHYEQGLLSDFLSQELGDNPPAITPVYFPYQASESAPLSWHLLPSQQADIGTQWQSRLKSDDANTLFKILGCAGPAK